MKVLELFAGSRSLYAGVAEQMGMQTVGTTDYKDFSNIPIMFVTY